jgi:hypothetical protein
MEPRVDFGLIAAKRIAHSEKAWEREKRHGEAGDDGSCKSQNSNNKQIPMTEIQNSKPSHHLEKREFQICLGH